MDEELTGGYSEICGQCGEVDWGVSDEGRFYCRSCHNVIERTKEVVDTNTFMIGASRVSSISKGTRRKKLEQGREWMVCEGFQFILKHQAEALLAMGVCPQFKDDVLCQFWRMYLQKSRQAYTKNPVHDGKFRLRSQGSGESDSAPESSVMSDSMTSASETDGDGDWASGGGSVSDYTSDGASSVCSGSIDAVSYLTPRQRRSQGLMSMPKTLALCHLALLWAREAITLADLLRFVNEGHIPYVNAYEDFPEEMKLYGRDSLIFRVESIPSYSHLHKEAQTLAVFLELPLFPPITLDCLLHPSLLSLRYLTEANLPDELHDWVCRIMEKAGMESSVTFEPMRSNSLLPHYDVQAAALIIIAMKLLFKLDDHTEWDLSNDASDKNKENPDVNSFNLRRWYRTMQTALTTAVRRQQDNIARKHWKAQKPLYTSKKDKSVVLKRRRIAEQLQLSFQKLSGSPVPPPSSPPSSFCFRWSEEGEEVWDGPSLHHQTLDSSVRQRGASLQPSNPKYWHPALKACKPRFCKSHYAEVEVTLPRMYVWLLNLFSFLMGVKPGCVYEEVLKVERHFLGSSKSQPRARATPRKTQPKKLPKRKQTRKTCSR
ncbi:TATA box-binding protein-associated factor RNA polymerase I subunit B isoform X1 [Salmo salar]|uniref:TATA box-binding protein-associated factor RNA polymerase I subunit B n=2 Tax=Salmo salar TaxID=8030 RepID=A0A1S3S7K8_SALSA|nr:TATA box-binding protein-associated factor RNA polymerase I subunit B isoform X1 [Salmo salar]